MTAHWKIGDVCSFQHRDEVLVGIVNGVDTALNVYAPSSMRPGERPVFIFNWRVPKEWATRYVKTKRPKGA